LALPSAPRSPPWAKDIVSWVSNLKVDRGGGATASLDLELHTSVGAGVVGVEGLPVVSLGKKPPPKPA